MEQYIIPMYYLKRDEKIVPIYPKFRKFSLSEERRRC
jgi:hypothetical protein